MIYKEVIHNIYVRGFGKVLRDARGFLAKGNFEWGKSCCGVKKSVVRPLRPDDEFFPRCWLMMNERLEILFYDPI